MANPARIALNIPNVLVLPRSPRIVLKDIPGPDGVPLGFTRWTLLQGDVVLETGRTDAEGRVIFGIELEEDAEFELRYPGRSLLLKTPALEPVTTVKGRQVRLAALGYHTGAIDGVFGPKTKRALADFQRDHELEETGSSNDETDAKLDEAFITND